MVKNPANARVVRAAGLICGLGRSSGGGNGNSLQYSCLENSMDRSLVGYSPRGCKKSDMTVHSTTWIGLHKFKRPQHFLLSVSTHTLSMLPHLLSIFLLKTEQSGFSM